MAPNDPIQLDHERRMARLEEARRELEDTVIVMSGLERRPSALLKEHSELIVRIEHNLANTSEKLSEMTDKLNGLIGWADSTIRREPPESPAQS